MKCANRVRVSGVLCLVIASASSGQALIEAHEEFLCTSGAATRIVSIYKRESGACRVDYTKDGKTNTLWMSKADYAYCTAKALSLVTHLVEAKYSCTPKTVEQPESR